MLPPISVHRQSFSSTGRFVTAQRAVPTVAAGLRPAVEPGILPGGLRARWPERERIGDLRPADAGRYKGGRCAEPSGAAFSGATCTVIRMSSRIRSAR